MERRAQFLIYYAQLHGPVTVRGLYYQCVVNGVPGIDKTEDGYSKVQQQVLKLRREGRMPYSAIADASRWMRRPNTHDGWKDALEETARFYRKSLWADRDEEVQIWLEKSALAGVIAPVTNEYDVPLMPTGGYSSESFAFEAVDDLRFSDKKLVVYALYDFDRSGQDASNSLKQKVHRFGEALDVAVDFYELGLTYEQVVGLNLPTRQPKRTTRADDRWEYDFAAELDAIPADTLRKMVRTAIERHLPAEDLAYLKHVEKMERDKLLEFSSYATNSGDVQ